MWVGLRHARMDTTDTLRMRARLTVTTVRPTSPVACSSAPVLGSTVAASTDAVATDAAATMDGPDMVIAAVMVADRLAVDSTAAMRAADSTAEAAFTAVGAFTAVAGPMAADMVAVMADTAKSIGS
jgi:hypothetical protein